MTRVQILLEVLRYARAGVMGYLEVNRRIQAYADEEGVTFDDAWTKVWDAAQQAGDERAIAFLMLVKAYRRLYVAIASFLAKRKKVVTTEDASTSGGSTADDDLPDEIALRDTFTAAAREGGVPVTDVFGLTRDLRTLRKHYPVPPRD